MRNYNIYTRPFPPFRKQIRKRKQTLKSKATKQEIKYEIITTRES